MYSVLAIVLLLIIVGANIPLLPSVVIFSLVILSFCFFVFRLQQPKPSPTDSDPIDYNLIIGNLEEGVMFVGNDNLCIQVNRRWEEITGYKMNELVGRDVGEILLYPKDIEFMKQQSKDRTKGISNRYEIKIKTRSKGDKWVFTIGTPLMNKQGEIIGSLGIMTDRTESIKKDKQLLSYSKELESSMAKLKSVNNELEQFAYIVSHDLRSPLNTISSFSNLLQRRHKEELGSDAQEYLDFINANCISMRSTINGLLHHAKFGINNTQKEIIPLHKIIENAIMNLQALIEQNKAIISYTNLPTINCDKIQIQQLFQNLIENSIKYKKKDEVPKIDIWHEEVINGISLSIKDNGIGIPTSYHERIFQIFNQINPDKSGLGLGLSICKKVVENHQGRISFESKRGGGCTFHVFLPSH